MKILSVFWSDKVTTGAHKRLIHLLRGLADRGHEVALITVEDHDFDTGSVQTIALRSRKLPSSKLDGVLRLATHSFDASVLRDTDVIVCFGLGSVVPGLPLKKKTGAKLLYALRGHPIKDVTEKSFLKQKLLEAKNSVYLAAGLRGADRYTVQVQSHKDALVRKHGVSESAVEIIPNNILEQVQTTEDSQHLNNLLFAGTICRRKGVDTLLKAFKNLAAQYEDLSLHIAGEGPMEGWARNYVSQNGLERQVVFHGYVDKMHQLMAHCDLVVIPSRAETFPNVGLEAMSAGLPFVVSDLEEMRSAFGNLPQYFPETDPGALADTISCLRNPETYGRLKQKIEEEKEHFHFDWVGRYESLLQEMLARDAIREV